MFSQAFGVAQPPGGTFQAYLARDCVVVRIGRSEVDMVVGPGCLVGLSRDEEIVTADLDDGNRERIDHDQVCTPVGACPECLLERIDGRVNIEALVEGNLGEDVIVGAVFRFLPNVGISAEEAVSVGSDREARKPVC